MRMDTKLGTALATAKASLCKFSASMSMQPKTNHYTTRSFSWPQQLPPQSLFRHLSSPSSASISASLSCWFHGADERCHEVRPLRARADLGLGRVRKGRKAGKKGTRAIKGESASSCMFLCKLVFWYFGVPPWNLSFYRKGDVGWNGGCLHTRVMAARERARKRTFYAAYGPNLGGGMPVLEILAWTGAKQGGCTTVEPNVESAHCQH